MAVSAGLGHGSDHQDLVTITQLEGKQLFVLGIELLRQQRDTPLLQFLFAEVHRDLERLTRVAQISLVTHLVIFYWNAIGQQRLTRPRLQFTQVSQQLLVGEIPAMVR